MSEEVKPRKGNGCGAEGSWIDPPDLFPRACASHDSAYGVGGTERHRMSADSAFFANMNKEVVSRYPWYLRPLVSLAIPFYHLGVRLGGRKHFGKK